MNRQIVLAEYLTNGDTTLLFGVRSDFKQPKVVELPLDQTELRRFVYANFRDQGRVRDLIEMGLEEIWHSYDYLIEPLARWSDPGDIIYLIPYGLLHYIPLHALQLEGQYLIERNPVLYSPSASVLKYCQEKRKFTHEGMLARQTAAIFGDPRGDLPFARDEATLLARLLNTEPLLGEEVTKASFQEISVGVDIVHFAGHGYFNSSLAMDSGLMVAGDEVLTAREILDVKGMHASLVTLSGCETGVNENRPGDELMGLTRAFLHAGTASVLVSLWRVPDASTAFLMHQFYTYLHEQPALFKVDVLRRAILDTKSSPHWASLYHWAPFVLIGDWQ